MTNCWVKGKSSLFFTLRLLVVICCLTWALPSVSVNYCKNIESTATGTELSKEFGIPAACWAQKNKNKQIKEHRIVITTDPEGMGQVHLLLRSMDKYVTNWRKTFPTTVVTHNYSETNKKIVEKIAYEIVRINYPFVNFVFIDTLSNSEKEGERDIAEENGMDFNDKNNDIHLSGNFCFMYYIHDLWKAYIDGEIDPFFSCFSTAGIAANRSIFNLKLSKARQLVVPFSPALSFSPSRPMFETLECVACLLKPFIFPNLAKLRYALLVLVNNRVEKDANNRAVNDDILKMKSIKSTFDPPPIVNIVDVTFSPTSLEKFGHITHNIYGSKPRRVQYIYRKHPWAGITVFTPQTFIFDYVVKQFEDCATCFRVAWFLEPRTIGESPYYKKHRGNEFKEIVNVQDLFHLILTSDDELIENGFPYTQTLFGGMWIEVEKEIQHAQFYSTRVHKLKTKLVSFISSTKVHCALHRKRFFAANYFNNQTENRIVDVYGLNGWIKARDGLAAYMYSIVFENDRQNIYFTEKLLNAFSTLTIPIYIGGKVNNTQFLYPYFNRDGIIFSDGSVENLTAILDILVSKELYYEKYLNAALENRWRARRFSSRDDIMIWKLRTLSHPVLHIRWQLVNELFARYEYGWSNTMMYLCFDCSADDCCKNDFYGESKRLGGLEIDSSIKVSIKQYNDDKIFPTAADMDMIFIPYSKSATVTELRYMVQYALGQLGPSGMLIMEGTDKIENTNVRKFLSNIICRCLHSRTTDDNNDSTTCISKDKRITFNTICSAENGNDCIEDGFTIIQFGSATTRLLPPSINCKREQDDPINDIFFGGDVDDEKWKERRELRRKIGELLTMTKFHEYFLY